MRRSKGKQGVRVVSAHKPKSGVTTLPAIKGPSLPSLAQHAGVALVRASPKQRALPQKAPPLQQLIEQTVSVLLMTASEAGDLHFRADVQADVMEDLTVDVGMYGRKLAVTFYTKDSTTRRLLSGHTRELTAVLESRGLKVHKVQVLGELDPNEPPPVPVYRRT